MGLLVLVRHGQSEWNSKRIFSGQGNPKLTSQGIEEAKRSGQLLKSKLLKFDLAYSSRLERARKTLDLILAEMEQSHLHIIEDKRFNERDYGDLTGITVEATCQKYGVEQVRRWRQSFDEVPPGGESLEMTAKRTSDAFNNCVLPHLLNGKNIIIAAHRNSLRALVSVINNLKSDEIERLNIRTAEPLFFQVQNENQIEQVSL